jgi:hypothetical protein
MQVSWSEAQTKEQRQKQNKKQTRNLWDPTWKITKAKKGWIMAHVVDEALSWNPTKKMILS